MNQKTVFLMIVSILWLATAAHSQQVEATPASAVRPRLPNLPEGARWEPEPITIEIGSAHGNGQIHPMPTGAFSVTRTDQGVVMVTIIQSKDLGHTGWSRNRYFPVLLTAEGKQFVLGKKATVFRSMGHLQTHKYQIKHDDLTNCESIQVGIGIIDLASRLQQSRLASAQMKNAQVLPIPVIGQPFDFTLKGIEGQRIRDDDFRGKYLLIDCWATWCTPCMEKMPELKEINENYSDSLAVVGINFDDELEACEAAIKKLDLPWPEVHATTSALPYKEAWMKITQISNLPRLFLVNPDGVLIAELGPYDLEDQLQEQMKMGDQGAPGLGN